MTTPGASRFYRSEGAAALQDVAIRLEVLDGPLGLAGHRCLAGLFSRAGSAAGPRLA